MYFKLILLLVSFAVNLQSSYCDIFDDVEFQQTLVKCKMYCGLNDPNFNNKQTCYDLPDKQLVLTECEVSCTKITKDDLKKAGTCTCVSGRCVGDKKPPASSNSAIAKFVLLPELFALCFILYSIILAR